MDQLFEKFRKKLRFVPVTFILGLMDDIDWDTRLIGIKGARNRCEPEYTCQLSPLSGGSRSIT